MKTERFFNFVAPLTKDSTRLADPMRDEKQSESENASYIFRFLLNDPHPPLLGLIFPLKWICSK
jgi:hypothetical protein